MSTNTCTFIQVRALRSDQDPFELRQIGFAIQGEAKKAGASCVAWWKDQMLMIAMQSMSLSLVTQLVEDFTKLLAKEGKAIEITQRDNVAVPEGHLPSSNLERHALVREKLTKRLLLSLPSGAFVVSNCFQSPRSIFAEQLGSDETRLEAWRRGVEGGAAGRLCQVVWTESDFIKASFAPGF